jgi:ubiquitin-small subunit ribosomal protein S27Ae
MAPAKKGSKTRVKSKNHVPSKRYEKYKVKDGKLVKGKTCPKCGPGIFLGEHKNRTYCGKCGYSEFAQKTQPQEKK